MSTCFLNEGSPMSRDRYSFERIVKITNSAQPLALPCAIFMCARGNNEELVRESRVRRWREGRRGRKEEDCCEGRSREFNDIPDYGGTLIEEGRKVGKRDGKRRTEQRGWKSGPGDCSTLPCQPGIHPNRARPSTTHVQPRRLRRLRRRRRGFSHKKY